MILLISLIALINRICDGATVTPTLQPTLLPTYIPTAPPTTIDEIKNGSSYTIALPQLIIVKPGEMVLIRLHSYSLLNSQKQPPTYTIDSFPANGKLFQLSQVYSNYGYEPKLGDQFKFSNETVTGSNRRLIYKRPSPDSSNLQMWDSFTFVVYDTNGASIPGSITLVPPKGNIIGNTFFLTTENWVITGNTMGIQNIPQVPTYEPYSRGLLNHYILGKDAIVNTIITTADTSMNPQQQQSKTDLSLWYFMAPQSYYKNIGISYGGVLKFTLSSFSGDFKSLNDENTNVVILECIECVGPVSKGITLGFSMKSLKSSSNGMFDGTTKQFSIQLLENNGWKKDPQNSLLDWIPASQCDIIQVLSRLSGLYILGDWTTWYETVALDDVMILNTK
eukprot:gene16530-22564_t